jgi:hypothetical protein
MIRQVPLEPQVPLQQRWVPFWHAGTHRLSKHDCPDPHVPQLRVPPQPSWMRPHWAPTSLHWSGLHVGHDCVIVLGGVPHVIEVAVAEHGAVQLSGPPTEQLTVQLPNSSTWVEVGSPPVVVAALHPISHAAEINTNVSTLADMVPPA